MPYTLLLADDSVTIQRVIELTFADEDVTVVAVSDGDQAIERLEASPPPDIVLADIGMPGKNGYEVAQYIRQSPKLSHIPVVLLTGAFEPVDQARANEAGCDGVLAKPFEPQLVISRVKELLARSRRSPEASESHPAFGGGQDFSLPTPSTAGGDSIPESMWSPPQLDQRPVRPFVDPPFADAPMAAAQTGPVPRTELNDYFDRLDAAFSTLSNTQAPNAAPVKPVADPAPAKVAAEVDWFENLTTEGGNGEPWDLPAPPPAAETVDLPLMYASPQPKAPVAAPEPPASFASVTQAEPVPEAPLPAPAAQPAAPSASSYYDTLQPPAREPAAVIAPPAIEPVA
ncbi:MAG TPA: response regulator, partial [Vicinamibacterales bacterium]|nr:response regulator [Vicinamibacterales bacterium]